MSISLTNFCTLSSCQFISPTRNVSTSFNFCVNINNIGDFFDKKILDTYALIQKTYVKTCCGVEATKSMILENVIWQKIRQIYCLFLWFDLFSLVVQFYQIDGLFLEVNCNFFTSNQTATHVKSCRKRQCQSLTISVRQVSYIVVCFCL